MTFDAGIQTTYGEALGDLRDKVGGMTNWSVYEDNADGAASVYNDWFVLETPTGELIRVDESGGWITPEHGVSWDIDSGAWGDRYSQPNQRIAPVDSTGGTNETDSVKYWLEYVDGKGFAFYMTREVGDSSDYECAFGFAKVSQLWNYDAATAREGDYVHFYFGETESYGEKESRMNGTAERGRSGNTHDARGLVNPDGNHSNYPAHETNVIASTRYENSDSQDAFIGTHDLWLRDRSGTDSAHLDTITTGGTDEYTILKEYSTMPVAFRME